MKLRQGIGTRVRLALEGREGALRVVESPHEQFVVRNSSAENLCELRVALSRLGHRGEEVPFALREWRFVRTWSGTRDRAHRLRDPLWSVRHSQVLRERATSVVVRSSSGILWSGHRRA